MARSAFGDQQHAEHADQQDGALQEQRRAVDVDGAGDDRIVRRRRRSCRVIPSTADQRDEQRRQAQRELRAVARRARQERLDEHPGDGDAEDDQHRRQLAVFDAGRDAHAAGPLRDRWESGRGWWIDGQRVADGGVDDVQRGLRVHPEHEQQRDQRCHDEDFARPQIPHRLVALGDRAGHHPLVHPQHVERREHQRDRRRNTAKAG